MTAAAAAKLDRLLAEVEQEAYPSVDEMLRERYGNPARLAWAAPAPERAEVKS